MRCRLIALAASATLLGCLMMPGPQVPSAVATPTELTESYVYPYLYELRLRNPGCPIFVSDRPYVRIDLAGWLRDCANPDSILDDRSLWLRAILAEEFRGETGLLDAEATGWTWETVLGSRAVTDRKTTADGFTRFSLYSPWGLSLWTSLRVTLNDPDIHKAGTRVWEEYGRASMEHGGIGFRKEWFSFFFGRDEIAWGSARRRGLLFSGSAPSFDMLKIAFGTGRFRYTSFHSRLRQHAAETAEQTELEEWKQEYMRRYVSAHRLDIIATRELTVSLSEAVIYGGPLRDFEPVYLNPVGVFYAEQWNSHSDDNILIAGDFTVLQPGRVEIRGELMVDDFQYDFGSEPHKFAAGLGAVGVNPISRGRSMIGGSYYQVRNGTYNHHIVWNRFVHEDHIMGYPDGPDGDKLVLWASLALPDPLTCRLDYSYRRQGEGRVTDQQLPESPQVKFPSGTVESEHRIGLDVAWRPAFTWLLRGSLAYSSIDNAGNVEGQSDSGFDFGIGLTFNFKMAGEFGQ